MSFNYEVIYRCPFLKKNKPQKPNPNNKTVYIHANPNTHLEKTEQDNNISNINGNNFFKD